MGLRLWVRYFLVKRRLGWDDSKLTSPLSPLAAEVRVRRLLTDIYQYSLPLPCCQLSCRQCCNFWVGLFAARRSSALTIFELAATKHGLGRHIYNANLGELTTMVRLIWWSGVRYPSLVGENRVMIDQRSADRVQSFAHVHQVLVPCFLPLSDARSNKPGGCLRRVCIRCGGRHYLHGAVYFQCARRSSGGGTSRFREHASMMRAFFSPTRRSIWQPTLWCS